MTEPGLEPSATEPGPEPSATEPAERAPDMPAGAEPEAEADRTLGAWLTLWLETQLLVRLGGRSVDLDAVGRSEREWAAAIAPLTSPLTLVTAWNPRGGITPTPVNRAANRRLRAWLDARDRDWRLALGRARDGSWSEPGFAVGGLTEKSAAALGAGWDQLAVYVVTAREVIVVASDGSFRETRPRASATRRGSRPS